MSELEPIVGFVFCPLCIKGGELQVYCKFTIPNVASEKEEYLLICSCHRPEFPCPGEKK
jgi:hypothetical protein